MRVQPVFGSSVRFWMKMTTGPRLEKISRNRYMPATSPASSFQLPLVILSQTIIRVWIRTDSIGAEDSDMTVMPMTSAILGRARRTLLR